LSKVQERIIGEIAVEVVGRRAVPAVLHRTFQVLIDPPGHARLVEYLGKRLPDKQLAKRTEAVVGDRARSEAIRSAGAQIIDVSDAAGPHVAPVRIGFTQDRTVIIV
jgi:hypothetical protein